MPEKMFCLRLKSREHFRSRKNVRTPFLCSSHRRPPRSWNDAYGDAERKQKKLSKGRMERAKEEAQGMDQYDYVLINDDLETCVKQMHETIQSQHFMSSNQKDFIEQMKKSLEK